MVFVVVDDRRDTKSNSIGVIKRRIIFRGNLPKSMGVQGVTNSVVGIVGCGNIGIIVAEMLRGFKLSELLYTSRKPKAEGEY